MLVRWSMSLKFHLYVFPEGNKAIQPNLWVILFFRYGTTLKPVENIDMVKLSMLFLSLVHICRTRQTVTTQTFLFIHPQNRHCFLKKIPYEFVRMTSFALREDGVGLLKDRRWKSTVWSQTAPGKPKLHSALWEQWLGSSKPLSGTTLWSMAPGINWDEIHKYYFFWVTVFSSWLMIYLND